MEKIVRHTNIQAKWFGFTLIVIVLFFQSCAPFEVLPKNVKHSSEIIGVYSNDCYSTDYEKNTKLWELIDSDYSNEEDGLMVKLEITNNNELKAQLIRDNNTLIEKTIKGKLKDNQCFYIKDVFYFVPILPILFWYENDQKRIYLDNETLVVERAFNHGGAVIIMANGNQGNFKWLYQRIVY